MFDVPKLEEIEICPLCESSMVIKSGKYGYFWSCKEWPKCRGSITIKHLGDLSFTNLDFFEPEAFPRSDPFLQIKKIILDYAPEYVKVLIDQIERGFYKGLVDEDSTRGKVSGLISLLSKFGERFLLAQFSYFIYKVEGGELPERFDYFLKQQYKPDTMEAHIKHKEYQIKRAITNNWTNTVFYKRYGFNLMGEEVTMHQLTGADNQCKVDIVGKNDNNELALVEVKRSMAAGRSAWGQVHVYRETVRSLKPGVAAYIVTSGYPRGIIDSSIGLIGYTIQENRLALIPWREGKIIF